MSVIIIESPNKKQKIAQITGAKVFATTGHFMLLDHINLDKNYELVFTMNDRSKSNINTAINACKGEVVYIATDPDREGYGIGYHFYLKIKNLAKEIYRAEFHEITESGVKKGIKEAKFFTATNLKMWDAYQARVCADRIMGYTQTPYLQDYFKVKDNISAGRVQTPALYIIYKRDEEIQNYEKLPMSEKMEYQIQAKAMFDNSELILKHMLNGKEQKYQNKEEAEEVLNLIKQSDKATIKNIEKKETQSSPPKPFTTSKLLKKAGKKLGLSSDKIQTLAQNLFENGLITYIRTDSEALSNEFLDEAKKFYEPLYQNVYEKREYKAGKNSQAEAHEAIRITHPHKYDELEKVVKLNFAQAEKNHIILYDLIFRNTLQSQCKNAIFENTILTLKIRLEEFKLSFKTIKDKGYMGIFDNDNEENDEEEDKVISSFSAKEGDEIPLKEVFIKDIMKNKPKQYLEADFIEVLEKHGIGRPSTYATYLPKLIQREYIEISKDKSHQISITEKGKSKIKFYQNKFQCMIDLNFTAKLDQMLDDIAENKIKYVDVIKEVHKGLEYTTRGLVKINKDSKEKYPPSEKQLEYAKKIANKLHIDLPKDIEKDNLICSNFIKINKPAFDKTFKK